MKKPKRKNTIEIEFNLRCFTCGELINKDGGDGMAVWTEKRYSRSKKDAPFTILHKGKCDNKEKYEFSSELVEMFRKTRRKNKL